MAHSDAAGGYWVVSRYDDVRECAQDWQTFSNEGGFEPGRGGEGGAKLDPVELDPPYQTRWRNVLGPYFSPRAIRSREANIREQVNYLIDQFIGKVEIGATLGQHARSIISPVISIARWRMSRGGSKAVSASGRTVHGWLLEILGSNGASGWALYGERGPREYEI